MSPERWKKLEEIYNSALQLGEKERRAFLDQTCVGDKELRYEAETLLAADDMTDGFFKTDAFTLGMKVMADSKEMSSEETRQRFEAGFSVGKKLDDRYEIVEPLDEGGMGVVYKARDLKIGRYVVIKVLKKESQENPWIFLKFRPDAQSRVCHPNVETVLDKGTLPNGQPYQVMEFIEGSTLRKMIQDYKANDQLMDFSLVAEIMSQVGRGVANINRENLIHRDLDPKNIMVENRADTNELIVKIIDFGIVRDLNSSTVSGQVVGKLNYMSPEQLNGQQVTPASDVYSLGVIAHEMLTGRVPFYPENHLHLLVLQKDGIKVKPSDLRRHLPKVAERLILRALSYDANHRYDRNKQYDKNNPGRLARDFGDELAQALRIIDPPPPPRPRKRWLIAALLIVVLGVMLWGISVLVNRSGPPSEPALTYWLMVRMIEGDGTFSKPFPSSGSQEYRSGSKFSFVFVPARSGYLYIINEGPGASETTAWYVLFPNPKDNNGSAQLAANQELKTVEFPFDEHTGQEKEWIVWAPQPVPELEAIHRAVFSNKGEVLDSAQRKSLKEFFDKHAASPPEVTRIEGDAPRVILKNRSEILVSLLELSHKNY